MKVRCSTHLLGEAQEGRRAETHFLAINSQQSKHGAVSFKAVLSLAAFSVAACRIDAPHLS